MYSQIAKSQWFLGDTQIWGWLNWVIMVHKYFQPCYISFFSLGISKVLSKMSDVGENYVGRSRQLFNNHQRIGGSTGLSKKIESKQFY